MSDAHPPALPPPRPEDRLPDAPRPGWAAPEDEGRRDVAIALFVVLEVILLVVLIWAAWGGASDEAPAMGLGEGLTAIAVAAAIPSGAFLLAALTIRAGRQALSVVASVVFVGIGVVAGFFMTALVALTRVDAQEH